MALTSVGSRGRRLATFAGVGLLLYVWPLALDTPLLDPDEGLHAAIAREMLDRRDYIVPRILGEPFLDKPILYFWALAGSLELLGPTEGAVRLPGLLFAWLGVVATWLLARRLLGRDAGDLAYLFAATLIWPLAVAQAAVHDVALVPWAVLIVLGLWEVDRAADGKRTVLGSLGGGIAVGLALLTKGLVGVVLAGLPFVVWATVERRLTRRLVAWGLVSVALGVSIAAPWYLAMERARPGYLWYFFVERHLLGFATPTQVHGERPWWYYLPVVLGGGWPWILYLPLAKSWGRRATPEGRDVRSPSAAVRGAGPDTAAGLRLAWMWVSIGLVLLSVARSKLATYLLPAMPAVAVLAAQAWQAEARDDAPRRARLFGTALWAHALVGALIVPAAAWFLEVKLQVQVTWPVWLAAAAIAAGYGLGLAAWRARAGPRVLGWLVALMVATFVTLRGGLLPSAAPEFSARDLARYLNAQRVRPAAVWVVDERVGSLLFYLDGAWRRELTPGRIEQVPLGQLWVRVKTAPGDVAVVIAERDVPRVERGVRLDGVPFERAGRHRVYRAERLRDRVRAVVGSEP